MHWLWLSNNKTGKSEGTHSKLHESNCKCKYTVAGTCKLNYLPMEIQYLNATSVVLKHKKRDEDTPTINHNGIWKLCIDCDYQITRRANLKEHIQNYMKVSASVNKL